MDLIPQKIRLIQNNGSIQIVMGKERRKVERIARAFPHTNPDQFIGLLDPEGHEIGIIEDPALLDEASRTLLESKLKEIYFVPEILEIHSVTAHGTGSQWAVLTDDGEYTFRLLSRDALNGDEPPSIRITAESGKRFFIYNYFDLDPESRELTSKFLPDKIIRFRYSVRTMGSRGSSGGRGSGGGSSGGMGGGSRGGGGMSGGSRSGGSSGGSSGGMMRFG